jgi:hypothetical protein
MNIEAHKTNRHVRAIYQLWVETQGVLKDRITLAGQLSLPREAMFGCCG